MKELDRRAAQLVLAQAPMRVDQDEVQVLVYGEWLSLCRTDSLDDVCTSDSDDAGRPLEETRTRYLRKIVYGARVDDERFAVIDSLTDG